MSDPTTTPTTTRRAARATTRAGSHAVALVLAVGMCTAINLFTFAVLYDALFSAGPGLSENATQVLTGWGGGIIGVIGAVVGYQAGHNAAKNAEAERVANSTDGIN